MTVSDIYRHFQNYYIIIEDNKYTHYMGRLEGIPLELMNTPIDSVYIRVRKDDIILDIVV